MAHDAAALLIGLGLRSTALLGIALLVVAAIRRFSAEERHLLLMSVMLGLLVLPVATGLLPALGVPVDEITGPLSDWAGGHSAAARRVDEPAGRAVIADSATGGGDRPVRSTEPGARLVTWSPAALAVSFYFAVTLLTLGLFVVNSLRISRRLERAKPLTDPAICGLIAETASALGLRGRIRWLVSASDETPWAWGLWRPTIVLPSGFEAWSAEDKRNAIVHELSHLKRRDPLCTVLAQLCCALYWAQPLVWIAARRMKREAEHACDDRVLLFGADGAGYAGQLLEIAEAIYRHANDCRDVAAMAGASFVSHRIRSILDPMTRRKTVDKLKTTVAVSTMLALVAPLAALRSQESAAPSALEDPAFQALLNAGPSNDDELEQIVETLLANDRAADAEQAIVDWITRDADGLVSCRVCVRGLRDESLFKNELTGSVLRAFDAVETLAQSRSDAGLLMRLANISLESGGRPALGRGIHYLLQADALGGPDRDMRRLTTMRYLVELGQYAKAGAIARALYEDASSRYFESAAMQGWLKYIENEQERIGQISKMLVTSEDGAIVAEGEYLPLYKAAPLYPEEAAKQGREGQVIVEYTVGTNGKTKDVRVYQSSDSIFNEAAVASAELYRYAPRMEGGVPVEVPGVRTIIRFALER